MVWPCERILIILCYTHWVFFSSSAVLASCLFAFFLLDFCFFSLTHSRARHLTYHLVTDVKNISVNSRHLIFVWHFCILYTFFIVVVGDIWAFIHNIRLADHNFTFRTFNRTYYCIASCVFLFLSWHLLCNETFFSFALFNANFCNRTFV